MFQVMAMSTGRPLKIIFDIPTKIDRRFVAAFDARLVETTTAPWNFWFGLLEAYVDEYGHANVPAKFRTTEGFFLGGWIRPP